MLTGAQIERPLRLLELDLVLARRQQIFSRRIGKIHTRLGRHGDLIGLDFDRIRVWPNNQLTFFHVGDRRNRYVVSRNYLRSRYWRRTLTSRLNLYHESGSLVNHFLLLLSPALPNGRPFDYFGVFLETHGRWR